MHSGEVYDPKPWLSGGGQEHSLCVVVFKCADRGEITMQQKGRFVQRYALSNHNLLKATLDKFNLQYVHEGWNARLMWDSLFEEITF